MIRLSLLLAGLFASTTACDEIVRVRNSLPQAEVTGYCTVSDGDQDRIFFEVEISDYEEDPVDVEIVRCPDGAGANSTCTDAILPPGPAGDGAQGLRSVRGTPTVLHLVEWSRASPACGGETCDAPCPDGPAPISEVANCRPLDGAAPSPLTVTVYARDHHAERPSRVATSTTVLEGPPEACNAGF